MDSKRAAEVLRGIPAFERSINQPKLSRTAQAADLGAQALEAWAWVERISGRWDGMTPLASVLDAMEKEKKG